ncbi:MAG: FemAB family PEP-CTERM system-associated protein [candidate division Zixibacteria bacterium]|nr:FemAB family PEP-CTERM system-associated protein [candidate division Zixibacteria bacterium]MDD5427106.1 FemAB family PEP-CTERM system-associated protein [candidate division Zixibacteria bacterium]
MIEIVDYQDKYESAWTSYVDHSPKATVAHQIGWRRAMQDGLGHEPYYLIALDHDTIKGLLPLFLVTTWWRTKYFISLPWIDYGGLLADDETAARALLDRARQLTRAKKAAFLEFRSVIDDNLDMALRTDKATFLLPLEKDAETVWKRFDAKLRNQIRKAEKSELTTEFAGPDKLHSFYKVFAHNMRDLGTPVWGREFFKAVLENFPQNAWLALVKKDDLVIAGGLVLAFKDRLYVPSASAYRHFLSYCPNHALYWSVIKYACEKGYAFFDFGRSSYDASTFKFKKQWTQPPTPLTWQYYLNLINEVPSINPGNPRYKLFIKLWQQLPLFVANYLGPKVIKNFP